MNSVAAFKPGPIEKNIPITPATIGRPMKYPWLELAVGDSFPVSCSPVFRKALRASLRMSRLNIQRRYGLRFEVRKDLKGFRIWRTA